MSSADVRLIALTHGLEVGVHGSGHLRELPEPARVQKTKVHDAKKVGGPCRGSAGLDHRALAPQRLHPPDSWPASCPQLPGWGVEGGDWAEIDRLNEEELAAAAAALQGGGEGPEDVGAAASHIASQVQRLSLQDAQAAAAALAGSQAGSDEGSSDEEGDSGEEGGEWETAAKSGNSQRRQRRKAARKAAWEARQAAAAAAAEAEQGSEGEEAGDEEGEDEGCDDACSLASDDDATAATAAPASDRAAAAAAEGQGQGQQLESSVCIVTADFAMQNVIMQVRKSMASLVPRAAAVCCCCARSATAGVPYLLRSACGAASTAALTAASRRARPPFLPPLNRHRPSQMGLRLVTPDGRRITRLSRWVLRCTACFLVTKEMGRLFCPRCGNASLDKVQLVVGPDGAEQYGVKRKHILRGTRFSLPKPKVRRRTARGLS